MPQEKFTQVLPKNWDGRFMFTNDSDEDFVFVWAKKAYLFPARQTVDMMRMAFNATPLEVQQIRKFAARKWGEREFFNSDEAKKMESFERNPQTGAPTLMSFQSARSYSDADLAPHIQRCLTPLPEGTALVSEEIVEPDTMDKLHRDEKEEFINKPVENTAQSLAPNQILVN